MKTKLEGVSAVTPFDKEKYLGKWFEIARFEFRFEKNLNNTTAWVEHDKTPDKK
jgi:apolipoprotein D and lipocalin family protein